MTIPKDHPRYESLMIREQLAEMVNEGLVNMTGLISHGRGEAFNYLMGEHSNGPAMAAEKVAAAYLLRAKNPVICANGNATVLDPQGLIALSEAIPAKLEVNIFHRTEERMESLITYLESKGAKNVYGRYPDAKIPGLTSDRAKCTRNGIFDCDVIVVPIEDGDRAEALVSMGKTVISIDLNPLSRTSKTSTVSISDDMSRALKNILQFVEVLKGKGDEIDATISEFSNMDNRKRTICCMCDTLMSEFE